MDLSTLALALALTASPDHSNTAVINHQPYTRTVIDLTPQPTQRCEELRVVRWKHKEVHRIINQCTGEIVDEIWIRY